MSESDQIQDTLDMPSSLGVTRFLITNLLVVVLNEMMLYLMQLRQQGRLTMECQNELFRQEVEGADDIRLNAALVSKCMSDKRTFCNDVAPGTPILHLV